VRQVVVNKLALCISSIPLLFGACVLDPTWGDEPTRRDPIDFSGMAAKSGATLRVQAWNYQLNAFENLGSTFTGTTNKFASDPDLFAWNRVGVTIPDRNWVPTGASCTSSGMANLRVQELNTDGTWSDLATFDAAGRDCVDDHLAAGEHPVAAGNACKRTNATIVLFAPPQCVPATTFDSTPADVTIRLTDGTQAWQRTSGSSDLSFTVVSRTKPLTATAMVRDREGAVTSVRLLGDTNVVCRRASDGLMALVPVAVSGTASQVVHAGELASISLDVSRLIDVNRLVTATCPAGFAFQRVNGVLFATGANATGLTVTSPALRFSI
jgi:hypothetical protein